VRQSLQAAPPPTYSPSITFKDYAKKWLEQRQAEGLAAKTVESDE
jgi:hypothetical protein